MSQFASKFSRLRMLLGQTSINFNICNSYSNINLVEELNIPVPWGKIAGRLWNPKSNTSTSRKVICIHGWKDNAATFDNLMPLLIPELGDSYQFLCIDLPGHGFSSHYPLGVYYHFTDSFIWILRVLQHMKWEKVSILAHSMGAILGFIFACSHPLHVERLIAIDSLTPVIFPASDLLKMIPDITSHLLRMDEKLANDNNVKTYTQEEAYQIMTQSHMMGIHESGCKILMTRGLKEFPEPASGRYVFSHDIRVQYLPITPFNDRQIGYMAKQFRSGLLHIKAEEGINYMSSYLQRKIQHWVQRNNNEPVKFINIPKATHHVHLTQPQLILDPIVKFMKN